MPDIADWLGGLGLSAYVNTFVENDVDLEALPHLTDAMLKEMGLSIGARAKIIAGIEAYKAKTDAVDGSTGSGHAATAESPRLDSKAQRRNLTVMFCDLVGSSALAQAMDPEELRTLIGAYQRTAEGIIQRYGGNVAQYLGDGVMAYFGWPVAHGNDAERAVRASLDLVADLRSMEAAAPVHVRIGVATGLVVVGDSGEGEPQLAVGETPNLASRLQGLAGTDEIVIGEHTSRLVGDLFELEDVGSRTVKGFADPVRVQRVVGVSSNADALLESGRQVTPFVGREPELALLLDRWADTLEGRGQIALVEGEPGFGKSRLISEFLHRVSGQRHARVIYRCSPFHTNSALHPVIEHVERAAGFEAADDGDARLDKLEALVSVSDEARALLAELLSLDSGRYPPLDLSARKQRALTLQALADVLKAQALVQPVVLIVEDAHWLDPTTRDALDLQFSVCAALPVMSIVTYRPEFQVPWLNLAQVVPLRLTRLGRRHAMDLVHKAAPHLPDEICNKVIEATDGIPLFIEEVANTLQISEAGNESMRDAQAHSEQISVPLTLHDSLNARLDRLGPDKELAQVAACVGRRFSRALLSQIASLEPGDLDAAMHRIVGSGLVYRERWGDDESFVFKHALVQQAAYTSLLNSARRVIHGDIADALARMQPAGSRSNPLVIAQHFRDAQRVPEALHWFKLAAAQAAHSGSVQESMQILDQALGLLDKFPGLQRQRESAELGLLTTKLPVCRAVKGWSSEEANQVCARALTLAARLDDKPNEALVLFQLATMYEVRGEFDKTQAVLARCNEILPRSGDLTPLVESGELLACSTFHQGRLDTSIGHAKGALEVANAQGRLETDAAQIEDPSVACLFWMAKSLILQAKIDQARELSRQAFDVVARAPKWYSQSQADIAAASLFAYLRDVQAVLLHAQRAAASSRRAGLSYRQASADLLCEWAIAVAGERQPELARIESSLEEFLRVGAMIDYAFYLGLAAEIHGRVGNYDKCFESIDRALAFCGSSRGYFFEPELHRIAGVYAHESGRPRAAAERHYEEALKVARAQGAQLFELRTAIALARLWIDGGEDGRPKDLLTPIYARCLEGRDSPDLTEARELLAQTC